MQSQCTQSTQIVRAQAPGRLPLDRRLSAAMAPKRTPIQKKKNTFKIPAPGSKITSQTMSRTFSATHLKDFEHFCDKWGFKLNLCDDAEEEE